MGRRHRQRPAKPNHTGRNDKSGRFVMLPHRILESAAYASLDLVARSLLTELVMLFNGDNNGSIYLSAQDATARLGLSDKRPALRAFEDLQERGFIALAKDAHFSIKAADASRARCWRLSWHAWPECPVRSKRAPTNGWEQFQAPGNTAASKRADRRLRALARHRNDRARGHLPGVKSTPMEGISMQKAVKPGVKSTPAKSENDANPPFLVGVKSTPYIDVTMGSACVGWWATDLEAHLAGSILLLSAIGQRRLLARAA